MYQLLFSILLALGIIASASDFDQMSDQQKQQLQNEYVIVEDDQI